MDALVTFALFVIVWVLQAMPFVVAAVAALGLCALTIAVANRLAIGIGATLVLYFIELGFVQLPGFNLGTTLYPADLVFGVLLMATVFRACINGARPGQGAMAAFLGVVMLSLVIGLGAYGTRAGVDARPYFYFCVALLYVASFPVQADMVERFARLLAVLGFSILVLAITRWIIVLTPISALLPESGSYNTDSVYRVVASGDALVMAQTALAAALFPFLLRARRAMLVAGVMLVAVVLLQHRSVWVATLAGFLGYVLFTRVSAGSKSSRLFGVAALAAVLMLPIALSSKTSGALDDVGRAAQRGAALSDTAGERLYSWTQLITKWKEGGAKSIFIGQPFGAENERYSGEGFGARKITYQAHNFFVQTLLRTGLVGVVSVLLVYVGAFRRLAAMAEGGDQVAAFWLMVLLSQLAYFIPYGANYVQALALGLAVAYARSGASETRPAMDAR